MAKTTQNYSANAASNTALIAPDGTQIPLGEGQTLPKHVNDAFRALMADTAIAAKFSGLPAGRSIAVTVRLVSNTDSLGSFPAVGGQKLELDGAVNPALVLAGTTAAPHTYTFDTSDSSMTGALRFYEDASQTTEYTTGVTVSSGQTTIAVTDTTPGVLYYQLAGSAGLGGIAYVLGASAGGGGYADSDVDAHLNRSTANSGEVLSWTGTDYDWVAQSGGGGGNYTDADVNAHLNQSSAATGQVLQWDGGDYAWTNQTAAYTDSSVDAHLNRSTASTGEVLSWNGSDYDWVAQSSGGGGLADVVDDTTPQLGGNLDLNGNNVTGTGNIDITGTITTTSGGSVVPFYFANQAAFPNATTYHGAIAHSHADGAMYYAHGGSWTRMAAGQDVGTTDSVTFGGLTVDTDTLHVDATNNQVGIGTASPSAKLQIETTAEPGVFVKDTGNTAAPYVRVQGQRGDANRLSSFSGGLALEAYRSDDKIPNDKQLGTIYFGGNHTNGTEANISYAASISGVSDGAFNSVTDMPTAIAFHTGSSGTALGTANTTFGTERMRIDSSGNVGIGITSSISSKLHVADSLRVARSTASPAILLENSSYSGGDAAIRMFNSGTLAFYTDDDQRMQINQNGKVKVFDLESTGTQDVQANSNGQLVLPVSDERLKKEIADSPYGLAAVQALRPVTYRWRNEADRGSATEVGFVAQEVQAVIPEMVNEAYATGMLSVSYSKLTAVLTAAIQEQQTQIEALEARLAVLEATP